MKRSTLSAAVLAAMAASAQASDYPYYFTAGAGHTDNEISVDHFGDHMKHSYTNEVSLGFMFKDDLALEGSIVIPSIIQEDSRADVEQFRFNSLYFLSDDALKPYLTAAIGFEDMTAGNTGVSNLLLSVGAGAQYDFNETVFARAELRYDDMVNEYPEHTNYVLEVGYRFGSTAAAAGAAAVGGAAASQNNMTSEAVSQPATPANAEQANKLPATAAGTGATSAFNDADNDGIPDSVDQCKSSPANSMVDSRGCDLIKSAEALLRFPLNGSGMPARVQAYLDQIATNAKADPSIKIIVEGHADETGSAEYNKTLSMKRAKTVGDY
ncbi:MAG: outer membrane beta-barrel protein, partial [Thalassolituus sp.]